MTGNVLAAAMPEQRFDPLLKGLEICQRENRSFFSNSLYLLATSESKPCAVTRHIIRIFTTAWINLKNETSTITVSTYIDDLFSRLTPHLHEHGFNFQFSTVISYLKLWLASEEIRLSKSTEIGVHAG